MERFKKLLIYTGTEQPENAISMAFTLAIENGASLTLMEVIKPIPRGLGILSDNPSHSELETQIVEEHRHNLLQRASEYSDTAIPVDVIVKVGDPATEVIKEVLRHQHDLVIKTADGFSVSGKLFGSVARSLLRQCPCAMLLLRPSVHGVFDHVLAAIDVEDSDAEHRALNRSILSLSMSIAEEDNAQLHVVAAWDLWMEKNLRRRAGDAEIDAALDSHRDRATKRLDALMKSTGTDTENIDVQVTRGPAAQVISYLVEKTKADLLVMGTVCRTGVAGLLIGNTAENVLANVTCSVLALKPDGFICPVNLDTEVAEVDPIVSFQT